jgi:hypothetical protein
MMTLSLSRVGECELMPLETESEREKRMMIRDGLDSISFLSSPSSSLSFFHSRQSTTKRICGWRNEGGNLETIEIINKVATKRTFVFLLWFLVFLVVIDHKNGVISRGERCWASWY